MKKNGYRHSLMLPKNYVAMDLEATGNSRFNYIIEVSAIKVVDGEKVDEYSSILRPPKYRSYENNKDKVSSYVEFGDEKIYYVDSFIENLTGIDNKMIFFSESEDVVIRKFYEFIKDEVIVGHGMVNDLSIIDSTFSRVLGKHLNSLYIDTFNLGLFMDNIEYSLVNLCDRFCIENKDVHRAYSDSMRTFKCYERIVDELKLKYGDEYEEKFSNWMSSKVSSSIKVLKNKTMKSLNRKNWSDILEKYLMDGFSKEEIEGRCFVFDSDTNSLKGERLKQELKSLGAKVSYKLTPRSDYYVVSAFDSLNTIDKNKEEVLEKIVFINKNSSRKTQVKILNLPNLSEILFKTKNYKSKIDNIYSSVSLPDEVEKNDKCINSDDKNYSLTNEEGIDVFFNSDSKENLSDRGKIDTDDAYLIDDFYKIDLYNKNVFFYGEFSFDTKDNLYQCINYLGAKIMTNIGKNTDYIIVGEGGKKDLFYDSKDCDIFIGFLSMGANIKLLNEVKFIEYLDEMKALYKI